MFNFPAIRQSADSVEPEIVVDCNDTGRGRVGNGGPSAAVPLDSAKLGSSTEAKPFFRFGVEEVEVLVGAFLNDNALGAMVNALSLLCGE
jgi:hypothetical protein